MGDATGYMTVQEAADYLGVSAQTLRRWDAAGKLRPLRHPASGYRYYRRGDLEPFRLDYSRAVTRAEDIAGHLFQIAAADIEENDRLREPQREAHRFTREHFAARTDPAILQIPVGCGKTWIIGTLPFGIARGRVLVIAPNVTIRKNISDALDVSSPECVWAKAKVLSTFRSGPFAALLDGPDANLHDCIDSHFVVTNIQQLASSADRWLPQFPPDFFDMILVDEAHHDAAPSWKKVFQRFPDARVVGLTATPFRRDEQPLAGEVIYRYAFSRAMIKGYIKSITSRNVAPSEIFFTYRGDRRRHSLAEVMELREEAWFRRGVALSEECNRHIAESSIQRMNALRDQHGTKHQIIAAACSIDHARQVRGIYEEYGLRAREIYSELEDDDKESIIAELRSGELDCIVQVQMLGEGFDHPRLSVAAVFRPFRSLAPYIQFVGRIMRVIHRDAPDHSDNRGHIVSHVGLNNDAFWNEFREIDLEDQKLFKAWLAGASEDRHGGGGGNPRRFDTGMRVDNELISHFIEQSFLDPEDDRVLDKLLGERIPGTSLTIGDLVQRDALRVQLREKQKDRISESPTDLPVQPQRRRRVARHRLKDRTGSVAARILKDLDLSRVGREISKAMPNFQAVVQLLNRAINENLGIASGKRGTLSAEQTEAALVSLDSVGDKVRDGIRRTMGGKTRGKGP